MEPTHTANRITPFFVIQNQRITLGKGMLDQKSDHNMKRTSEKAATSEQEALFFELLDEMRLP